MYRFDMANVRNLLRFDDLFPKIDNYMKESAYLPQVELDTVPLYEIVLQTDILFTPKLRYYQMLLRNEVNKDINETVKVLEDEASVELTKFLLKKIRDAATTLMHDADAYLRQFDSADRLWMKVISGQAAIIDSEWAISEKAVFMHYAFAELTRCWLELQDRYAYANNGVGLYDSNLFYSTIVKRSPDKEFEVKQVEKYKDETKKFKRFYPDCCFLYDNEENFNNALQEFTNKLHAFQLISDDVDVKTMERLFRGRKCRNTYTWLGSKAVLTHLIRNICDDVNPIVTTWPEGTSKWSVVEARFVTKDGKSVGNIRNLNELKKIKGTD